MNIFPDTSKILTDHAVKYLRRNPKKPFFMYIHYMHPHSPYEPPKEYLKHIKYDGPINVPYEWAFPGPAPSAMI
jgi:phosphoglycerol transferase MdoB-like AlkP superfamily enzyme